MESNVQQLRDPNDLLWNMQCDMWEVIQKDAYKDVTSAAIVGIIEFLKWNLINNANG